MAHAAAARGLHNCPSGLVVRDSSTSLQKACASLAITLCPANGSIDVQRRSTSVVDAPMTQQELISLRHCADSSKHQLGMVIGIQAGRTVLTGRFLPEGRPYSHGL